MATSRNHFRYFALPAEIRNQIMEYVLIAGDIYIRPAKRNRHAQQFWKSLPSRPKRFVDAMAILFRHLSGQSQRLVTITTDAHLKGQSTIQQPGIQLLAACKQAYNDGHYMFFAMNTFHWPPGPVNTEGWYVNLQPEHQKMIKTICIDFHLADLTYGDMNAVEVSARRGGGGRPSNYDANAWSSEAMFELAVRMWNIILCLFCRSTPQNLRRFVGLERVIFQSSIGRCVLNSQLGTDENELVSLELFVAAVSHHFGTILQLHVTKRGWKNTKKWLERLS